MNTGNAPQGVVGNGLVAAGHEDTVAAALTVLEQGGNAYDAVIAAHLAACVAEPVLASLGGGGHLLALPAQGSPLIYDFFVQSPQQAVAADQVEDLDFRPIHGDFGDASQEFHIGLASIATPGCVAGIEAIHQDLCRLPLQELIAPACQLARDGVVLNSFQAYIHQILEPILSANADLRELFCTHQGLRQVGDPFQPRAMADAFEALAREGARWFYHGEPAQQIVKACAEQGGLLGQADFDHYQVARRQPLARTIGPHRVLTNPVPSVGGSLILFQLELIQQALDQSVAYQSPQHLRTVAHSMRQTSLARRQSGLALTADSRSSEALLKADYLKDCAAAVHQHALATRGTTHISIIDNQGNLASLTITNGEGSGLLLPDLGIHLNNMLGEEDLNPRGFHCWHPDRRLASMMAPSAVIHDDGGRTALGSGGSNRIRTAIAQVLGNLLLFDRGLQQAVDDARMHLESELLNIEPGFPAAGLDALRQDFPGHLLWQQANLFFGGVHAVHQGPDGDQAVADPRRGGAVGRCP